MKYLELHVWKLFVDVVNKGNRWAENYKELVEKQLENLQDRGSNEVHFLHSHQEKFSDNCGDLNNE